MLWIILFVYNVRSLWPQIKASDYCITYLIFQDYDFKGSNDEYLLFELLNFTILLPQSAVGPFSSANTDYICGVGSQLWLQDRVYMQIYEKTLIMAIQQADEIRPFHYLKNVQNFSSSLIQSSRVLISSIKANLTESQNYFNLSLLFVEQSQVKYQEYIYKFECEKEICDLSQLEIKQYNNQILKSIIIILKHSGSLFFIDFSLIDRNFKILYQLDQNFDQIDITESGILLLLQNWVIKIYKLSESKLEFQSIFDRQFRQYSVVKDLKGKLTNYVVVEIQKNQTQLFEIIKVDNKYKMVLIRLKHSDTLNNTFPKHAFKTDQYYIVFLYSQREKIIINLSTHTKELYTTSVSSHNVEGFIQCLKYPFFWYDFNHSKIQLEFGKYYKQYVKKGDILQWIVPHQKNVTYKLTASFKSTEVICILSFFSPDFRYGKSYSVEVTKPNWTFFFSTLSPITYYEVIFLSDNYVSLFFSIQSYNGQEINYTKDEYIIDDQQLFEFILALVRVITLLKWPFLLCGICFLGFFLYDYYQEMAFQRKKVFEDFLKKDYLIQEDFSPQFLIYEEEVCPICIGTFEMKQKVTQTLCGHTFHSECLKAWFKEKKYNIQCPTCNQMIEDKKIKTKKKIRIQCTV